MTCLKESCKGNCTEADQEEHKPPIEETDKKRSYFSSILEVSNHKFQDSEKPWETSIAPQLPLHALSQHPLLPAPLFSAHSTKTYLRIQGGSIDFRNGTIFHG